MMPAPGTLKIALCNEVLHPLPFERQCALAAAMGYDGLEVAPFTLVADPMDLTDAQAHEFARTAQAHGLAITGLHWLLVAPKGLSITSDDDAQRQRTQAVMARMVELCAVMGGSYLVHGSHLQRAIPPGATHSQARDRARDCLTHAARRAEACGVTYCLEPLAPEQTQLFTRVEEAAELVREVGSPALRAMIDCSAAGLGEREPVPELIERWMPTGLIGHMQVNDPNRRGPGEGEMAFALILRSLQRMRAAGHYGDWISAEPFDYVPDGPTCAARSIGYLRGVLEALGHDD